MKNEKQIWVERMMMNASTAASPAHTKDAVLSRILDVLDQRELTGIRISFNQFRLVGIAAMLILALNIGVVGFTMMRADDEAESRTAYSINTYNLDLY